MKVTDIQPDRKNARRRNKRALTTIEHSLRELGAGRSIVIDKNGQIIAGNGVAEAAAAAGITEIEVVESDGSKIIAVRRTDLDLDTDAKARELAIADNRSAELAGWNPEVLAELSADLDLQPYFTDDELRKLTVSSQSASDGSEDDAPEAPETEPKSKPGDLYIMGRHRLLCGDATNPLDVDSLLNRTRPDLAFTDPPYGIRVQMNNPGTICKETILGDESSDVASAAYSLLAAMDVPLILWGANHYVADAGLPNAACWLTWNKQESNNHIDHADCELAWTNLPGPARIFHHLWAGFRRDSEKGERRVHPTQKPVALIVEILDFFKAGKSVLDLFGGSGSTLIACERTKRSCYTMELDPRYVDVIVARWEALTGKKAQLWQDDARSRQP